MTSLGAIKSELTDFNQANQLQVPPAPSRQYRSKSVDVSLSGLSLDDAKITIDVKNNEITITPTGSKDVIQSLKADKTVTFKDFDEKIKIGDKITQAIENFQDGLQLLGEYRTNNEIQEKNDEVDTKLTIRGPGSYIKKLIQQFSEGPFEAEDPKPESERAISKAEPERAMSKPEAETAMSSIKDKADALCKKCLHYKGKISK